MQRNNSHYSKEFVLTLGFMPFGFTEMEREFKNKWKVSQNDPDCEHLHFIGVYPDSSSDDSQYSCLSQADNRSRITIIGHHYEGDENLLGINPSTFHYTEIVDLIRQHVGDSVVMHNDHDVANTDRALRIRFIACEIDDKPAGDHTSFAEKFFSYAVNHTKKPLRIELVAPTMQCLPLPYDKSVNISLYEYLYGTNTKYQAGFHKRYIAWPWERNGFFSNTAVSMFSHFWPAYRPDGYKTIFKIDTALSCYGQVVARRLTPEDERCDRLRFGQR